MSMKILCRIDAASMKIWERRNQHSKGASAPVAGPSRPFSVRSRPLFSTHSMAVCGGVNRTLVTDNACPARPGSTWDNGW